jgi:TorA maturation chaperone TorD
MREAARLIDSQLEQSAARLGAAFSSEKLEDLLVEYTRLFLGPVDAPAKPYGSVWLGGPGALMQDSTLAASRLYQEGGFELSEEFRDLPDHIAAELEFLYLLLFRHEEARQNGEADGVREIAALKRRFLDEHLGAWVGRFAHAVTHASQSAFYRELAGLTERFVRMQAT